MPRARVRPEAARAIHAQADYYHAKGTPDTAERWYQQTNATFQYLAENPTISPAYDDPRYPGTRVALVHGFERFLILYRPVEEGIEVLHVALGTRNPRRRF